MLKIGDKVRIRKYLLDDILKKSKHTPGIVDEMAELEGKFDVIKLVENNIYNKYIYRLKSNPWSWIEEYLEKTDELKMDIE